MRKLFLISIFSAMGLLIHSQNNNIVYLQNGKFKLNGNSFYPITCNYLVNIVKDVTTGAYHVSREHAYGNGIGSPTGNSNDYECNSEAGCLNDIQADFQLLKDLKFNSIRLIGFAVGEQDSDGIMRRTTYASDQSATYNEEMVSPYADHFILLKKVLDIADAIGLKVVVLTGLHNTIAAPTVKDPTHRQDVTITIQNKYSDFLTQMALYFKNNTAIMAYDLCNEPAGAVPLAGSKTDICSVVSGWISNMKNADPNNHLITVGFTGSGEVITVGGWDPAIIPVDFASFHPYPVFKPFNESIVQNQIYWYKNNIQKPWIIGEIGMQNLVETPNIDEQDTLLRHSLRWVVNCNGAGYSWWEYSDKPGWGGTYDDYGDGLLNNDITNTQTSKGQLIQGALKQPFASDFGDFVTNYTPNYNCTCQSNYYNQNGCSNYLISGVVKNANTNAPIQGAIVGGWDIHWRWYETYTDANGVFNLYSDTLLRNDYAMPRASGAGYSMVMFNYTGGGTSPIIIANQTIDIGSTLTQNTSSSITCSNFTVKGNGTTGGNVTLYGGAGVDLQNLTSVEYGATLDVKPKYFYNQILLTPLSSCNTPKSADNAITPKNNYTTNELNQQIKVYPNPSGGLVNIQLNTNEQSIIEIFDTYGNKVFSKISYDQTNVLDISSFNSGIYILRITTSNGSENRKLIRK